MAEFLDSHAISAALSKTIKDAELSLTLISPYLKISDRIKELIADKTSRDRLPVRVVYGKSDLQSKEQEWLDHQTTLSLFYCENLHAKLYLSENRAILTSMNLYQFSQEHNTEAGILVCKDREEDKDLFKSIEEEANRIIRASKDAQASSATPAARKSKSAPSSPSGKKSSGAHKTPEKKPEAGPANTAYCLRDGEPIPFSMKQPYCAKCFKSWSRYEDKDYEEKYCHGCGKEQKSSMAKPLCGKCFHRMTANR